MSKKKAGSKAAETANEKLGAKDYERELEKLHVELVKLQEWVVAKGLKVCVVFEGRDGAGKGGTIKAITERVSPRVFRVIALPSPTEREKSQMYVSSSSIAAGTTGPASSGSWASPTSIVSNASSRWRRCSRR
jgi:polyphosphate kinase